MTSPLIPLASNDLLSTPEWVALTIQPPQSARPGKHFTTIDVSRRARADDLDEKQMLLLLQFSKSGGG